MSSGSPRHHPKGAPGSPILGTPYMPKWFDLRVTKFGVVTPKGVGAQRHPNFMGPH